jgi:hypothetical protein
MSFSGFNMNLLRQTVLFISSMTFGVGLLQAQPFDDGTKSFSLVAGPYVQQSAHRDHADAGLSLDVRSRISLHVPAWGKSQIDWVSRINGNFAFESDQNTRRLQQFSAGPQWSFDLSPGRVWLGAGLGFETNGASSGRQKLTGFNGGWYTPGLFGSRDAFQFQFQHAGVNPQDDPARAAQMIPMSSYRRWDAQVNYRIALSNPWISAITLSHQHYLQPNPAGGGHRWRNRADSIRFDLPQQFYLQHDRGTLPLDPFQGPHNSAWRLGWEYRLN